MLVPAPASAASSRTCAHPRVESRDAVADGAPRNAERFGDLAVRFVFEVMPEHGTFELARHRVKELDEYCSGVWRRIAGLVQRMAQHQLAAPALVAQSIQAQIDGDAVEPR